MAWTSPRTWAAGETLTAALLNAHVRDNLKAIGDPWTAYTPTWGATTTAPTLGNGTLTGSYIQAGKLVFYRISLTFGSTTTVGSGLYTFTAPVAAKITAYNPAGNAQLFDASVPVTRPNLVAFQNSATVMSIQDTAGAYVTDAAPYAWAAGDRIILSGAYESA